MIQKTTKIICDNCGQGIHDISEDLTYRQIAEICKEKNIATIRYKVGSRVPLSFCNEKCCKDYEDKMMKEWQRKMTLKHNKNVKGR